MQRVPASVHTWSACFGQKDGLLYDTWHFIDLPKPRMRHFYILKSPQPLLMPRSGLAVICLDLVYSFQLFRVKALLVMYNGPLQKVACRHANESRAGGNF